MANVNTVAASAMRRHVHDPNSLGYAQVIYTPLGGDAETIDAIVHWGEGDQRSNDVDGVLSSQMTEIDVDSTDVPSIQRGDGFTINGIAFLVADVPRSLSLGLTTIVLENLRHLEKSDGGVQRVRR